MSAATSQPQPLTAPPGLDNATLAVLVRSVIDAVPVEPGTLPREIAVLQEAAVAAALDFRPRNPREAMLAARIVNFDRASAECLRRATLKDLPQSIVLRFHATAMRLAGQAAAAAAALQALQKLAAPPVLRAGSARAVIAATAAMFGASPPGPAVRAVEQPMHGDTPAPRLAAVAGEAEAPNAGDMLSAPAHARLPAARPPAPCEDGAEAAARGTVRILDPGETAAGQAQAAAKVAVAAAMQRRVPALA